MMRTGSARLRAGRTAVLVASMAGLIGCSTSSILDVDAPEVIQPDDASGATGAAAVRAGILARVATISSGGEGMWFFGGLASDEWRGGDTFVQRNTVDQRVVLEDNSFLAGQYRALNRVRVEGARAITALRTANQPASTVGELQALTAYALNLTAEHFCNGLTLGTIDGTEPVNGVPVPTDSAYVRAIAFADSALVSSTGNATFTNLAAVVRGRALLNRGRYAEAAAAVAAVPTTFVYLIFHSANSSENQNWTLNVSSRRYSVGDVEGRNGLPFRSANDPRVRATTQGAASSFDNITPFLAQLNFDRFTSAPLANGIEARMIQAEAALQVNDVAGWLGFLNLARSQGGVAGLAPLTDPGSADARVNLTFRERAFWLFGTGHRFGDLRRLVRQYGRPQDQVFPTGTYPKGGAYGTAVAFPLPIEERNNPNYKGCTNLLP